MSFSMKKLSRRDFLKSLGVGAAGLSVFAGAGVAHATLEVPDHIPVREFKLKYAKETPSVCSWCGCGCGLLVHTVDGVVVGVQGDPDNPINEGTMCPKGRALSDVTYIVDKDGKRVVNPYRALKVLYRAPYSDRWEEKTWDWAISEIAKRIKATRDGTFERTQTVAFPDAEGNPTPVDVTVNRTQAIGFLGGASNNNEECYLAHKLMRALGVINMDHHARL